MYGRVRSPSRPLNSEVASEGFFLAIGFGAIIVPGHGEWIAAPILAALTPPLRSHLLILGGVFLLVWWVASFVALRFLAHRSSKLPGNDF